MAKSHNKKNQRRDAKKPHIFTRFLGWLRHLCLLIRCFFANRLKIVVPLRPLSPSLEAPLPLTLISNTTLGIRADRVEAATPPTAETAVHSDFIRRLLAYRHKRLARRKDDPLSWLRAQKLSLVTHALAMPNPTQAFEGLDQEHTHLCQQIRKEHRFLCHFVAIEGRLGQLLKDFRVIPVQEGKKVTRPL